MISQRHLTLVEAWNELNKVLNEIQLKETLITTRMDIGANKLKEILTQCTVINNDKFINAISSNDADFLRLRELYEEQRAWETYIDNEMLISKLSQPVICIAFLKEYYLKKDDKKMTWEDISKKMGYSIAQCKRFYDEYRGYTPSDNCSEVLSSQNELE